MSDITFNHNRLDLWIVGREFKQPDVRELLLKNYKGCRYKDAIQLLLPEGELWIFDYGVAVAWGINEQDSTALKQDLITWVDQPAADFKCEQYLFEIDEGLPLRIHSDKLTLPVNNTLTRLAASHAFAQSAKLIVLENEAQRVITENRYLSKNLAETGSIPLGRKRLAQRRGSLFETRADILLHFGLLDTPDFFWDYPELEATYSTLAKYLELQPRTEILNRKLEAIHELLEILASEQNHKHSSFLEWIIIILIAVDIVFILIEGH